MGKWREKGGATYHSTDIVHTKPNHTAPLSSCTPEVAQQHTSTPCTPAPLLSCLHTHSLGSRPLTSPATLPCSSLLIFSTGTPVHAATTLATSPSPTTGTHAPWGGRAGEGNGGRGGGGRGGGEGSTQVCCTKLRGVQHISCAWSACVMGLLLWQGGSGMAVPSICQTKPHALS